MKQKRRLHRAIIPFAVVLTLIFGTLIAHWIEEPDTDAASYLSPASPGPHDSTLLAAALRQRGINVQRHTGSTEALKALWSMDGKATLFIAAPEFVHPTYLQWLRYSPEGTRIVLVEPDGQRLAATVDELVVAETRFATKATIPGRDCTLTKAGVAGVTRTRYNSLKSGFIACYEYGLVSRVSDGIEFVVAGSADPFRAERAGEHDNTELAADLLSARPTLVWLDIHSDEKAPHAVPSTGTGQLVPSRQPPIEVPVNPEGGQLPEEGDGSGQSASRSAYPPWVWFVILILLLAVIATALAFGRRLGQPVVEPLPVRVPAAETARGRGRLYRRAKARGAAMETLRAAARRKIALGLGLPANVDKEQLLAALPERAEAILYGPAPDDDEELTLHAAQLQTLTEEVLREKK